MYQSQLVLSLYSVSPVHMGAGNAVGVIDNPIQRERHTGHPSFAGSGLKGALRHGFTQLGGDDKSIEALFGAKPGAASLHAGALSLGDAQLLVFPVRSLRQGFVYATCPQALARASRLLTQMGTSVDWNVPGVADGTCLVADARVLASGKLHLEAFEYAGTGSERIASLAADLARRCLPDGPEHAYFRDKISRDLVVLSDTDFDYFSEYSTLVEAHVRIDEDTGTASDRGLFYSENLPPEAILLAPMMASATRTGVSPELSADDVLARLRSLINDRLLQIGGDATTGRGLVLVHAVGA